MFRAMYGAASGPPVKIQFVRDAGHDRDPDDRMVLVDVVVNRRNAVFKVWASELDDFCKRRGIPVPESPRLARPC